MKDYFGELETLQDALVQVKVLADGMASKNRDANVKLSQTECKLLNLIKISWIENYKRKPCKKE